MSAVDRWLREGWLRPLDHALAASLQRLTAETPDSVALAAALASRALAFGHSLLPLDRVADLLTEISPERPPPLPDIAAWRAELRSSPYVSDGSGEGRGRPLVLVADRIALKRYHEYEVRLARSLGALGGPVEPPIDAAWLRGRLEELFPRDANSEPDRQALAAALAQLQRVVLLTGGPGTGKTTTIARVLALAVGAARRGDSLRVALAAPTGKAAARLSEALRESYAQLLARGSIDAALRDALPSAASTLHRLLGGRPDSVHFRHDAENPLPADLVVVDEASMVDLPLMCKLVEAVPPGARLILLGDRDQLPSVETGDVLASLCDAAGDGSTFPEAIARSLAALLGAPVRAANDTGAPLTRVELDRSHRQSADLDIAGMSAAIRAGDAGSVIDGLRTHAYRGVRWHVGRDAALSSFVLDHALPHYRAIASASDIGAALAMLRRHRILTAVREGDAGSRTLNARIAQALQGPGAREDTFFHGRPVMIRENSYRHGLYNGDVGLVWLDADGDLRVWFDTDSGPRAWLPAALPAHESAFALTVHKSQGSEFDDVLLVLPERSVRVSSRELLYTGITRARRSLALWANENVLAEAIARRAQRWSGLAERLATSGAREA